MTTWSIVQCDDYLIGPAGPYEGDPRVIYTVHWQCVDGPARIYSSESLEPFAGGEFVPWDTVTEEMALEWLHGKMGAEEVARIEADVTATREHIENPTTGRGTPWAPVPSASPSA
jgi:hypothetical protein